jgi:hypothetical protein
MQRRKNNAVEKTTAAGSVKLGDSSAFSPTASRPESIVQPSDDGTPKESISKDPAQLEIVRLTE